MSMLVIIISILVLAIIAFSRYTSNQNHQQKYLDAKATLASMNFTQTKTFDNQESWMFVSVDDEHDKIFFYSNEKAETCSFEDILSVELIIDGHSAEVHKSTLGTIGGAAVGGLLGGEAGAIIGGLSSSSNSKESVNSLDVHVSFRNLRDSFDIKFLTESVETTSDYYKDTRKKAYEVMDMIKYAIDKAARKEEQFVKRDTSATTSSVTNELARLSQLHRDGALTDEEFSALKAKIINR